MIEMKEEISSECRHASHFVTVKGSKMHYIESGQGDPVVFVHGIPTYSYLWRNIIPAISDKARCIAPDLIGMGLSDKPDIGYRVFDHIEYFTEFMDKLQLKNVTLVLHGWGSVIGFRYAQLHPDNIKALAFYESHVRPATTWDMLSLPVQQFVAMLSRPEASYRAIVQQNYLIRKLLPSGVIRNLTSTELANYAKPYPTPASRKVLWQYTQDLPKGDGPKDVVEMMQSYSQWLQQTGVPKLMLYSIPGFITTVATVQWARDHLKNLEQVGLDDALHFAQESLPELFREILREWYLKL